MTKKEKIVQHALGTLTPFTAYGSVEIPVTIILKVPIIVDISAVNECDGKKELRDQCRKMSPDQLKKFLVRNLNTDCDDIMELYSHKLEKMIFEAVKNTPPDQFKASNIKLDYVEEKDEENY